MFGSVDLVAIFTTGLLAGGLSCIAVQGGLLAAVLAQQEEKRIKDKEVKKSPVLPVTSFLIAKLFAYTLLGLFLGWLGEIVSFSILLRIVLQAVVVLFMVGTALHLLNIHPIFRYFVIQPPAILGRLMRKQTKRSDVFAPFILGALTVFIPCGTTQAMMALAIASGNPFSGALVLFTFTLATSPLFFVAGFLLMKIGDALKARFTKIAAFSILLLALLNFDTTLALTGTQYTLRNLMQKAYCVISYCPEDILGEVFTPVTEQTIHITTAGYDPNRFAVPAGATVTLHLVNKDGTGCAQAFTVPALNEQRIVRPGETKDLVFTAPTKPGKISFMCSQGLYPGTIIVL